jgi:hypothetical protein
MPKIDLVAIITDFGTRDPYVAQMKGVILGGSLSIQIVDITHEIPPHNVRVASFFLKTTEPYFPKNTCFLAVVDPGVGTERRAIVLKWRDRVFVGPDNGIFTPFFFGDFKAYELGVPSWAARTFHGRDVFAWSVRKMLEGIELEELGKPFNDPVRISLPEPEVSRGEIRGEVLFSDHFGNLITNIPKAMLEGKRVKVEIKGEKLDLKNTYREVKIGEPLALIGSFNTLEIAVREGSAARHLKAGEGTPVRVILHETEDPSG